MCMCVCTVFKILKLFPDKIECAMNLRDLPHKQVNLKFSSNDVQWNPNEGIHMCVRACMDVCMHMCVCAYVCWVPSFKPHVCTC